VACNKNQDLNEKENEEMNAGPYGKGYPRGKKTAAGCPPCGPPAGRRMVGHGGPA
jgi:hypothetical protein